MLPAHITLFHHLPAEHAGTIGTALAELCRTRAPFPVAVTGLRSLGRGVAFALASPELSALRAALARNWAASLTRQDRQTFRPHVTIQNKVTPDAARALLRRLSAGFASFTVTAEGLLLWRYRDGPWDPAGAFWFNTPPSTEPSLEAGAAGQD